MHVNRFKVNYTNSNKVVLPFAERFNTAGRQKDYYFYAFLSLNYSWTFNTRIKIKEDKYLND